MTLAADLNLILEDEEKGKYMITKKAVKILGVSLLILVIMYSFMGCHSDEVAGTWYLVENDSSEATLELNKGIAVFRNSGELEDKEFEYSFEEDTLILLNKEDKQGKEIKLTLYEDENYGKVLLKDGEIYACASKYEAENVIKEKEKVRKDNNIAVVENRTKLVKKTLIGDWRANDMTPSYHGVFSFYDDGTYCWSIREQYSSGRPPMKDKYKVYYEASYDGGSNPEKVEIIIGIYDNENKCWIEFTYDEKEDVLFCKDESAKGPYYRLTPSFEFQEVTMIPQSVYRSVFLDYYMNEIPNSEVKWSSDNQSVAKVNNSGAVTAIGEGKTRIYAQFKGKSYSFKIKVVNFNLQNVKDMFSISASEKVNVQIGNVYYWDGIGDWMVPIGIYTGNGECYGSADFYVYDSTNARSIYMNPNYFS